MDPNYTIVRCPAGHELQAERQHLHLALTCPVCGVTFTPGRPAGGVDATFEAPPPITVGYATSGRVPPSIPAYTTAMLVLWIIWFGSLCGFSIYQAISPLEFDPNKPPSNMGSIMALGFGACVVLIAFVVAVVFQLMWIHRIHRDAAILNYNRISPGLALGLSFIVLFNYAWTGWALWKLAEHSDQQSAQRGQALPPLAGFGRIVFMLGVVLLLSGVLGSVLGVYAQVKSAQLAAQGLSLSEIQKQMTELIPLPVQLIQAIVPFGAAIAYAVFVKRLERKLYALLGAAPQS